MSPNLKIYKTKDNASGQLNAGISAGATSIPLQSGDGAAFPSTINGTATSSGDADTLNSTGIGSSGVAVGDQIYNITDGSWAIIESISTNSIETTPLQGGSGNTWDNSDAWVVGAFIATIVQYNTTNDPDTGVNKREKVLVTQRSTDTLTVVRGYDDSTAQSFLTNDNVYLFMKTADLKGVQDGLADLLLRMVDIEAEILADVLRRDGSVAMNNNTALKARNAANSADISLFKLLSSDILEFQTLPRNPSSRSISDDYDILDKKYFDDNQITSRLVTAGETITVSSNPIPVHISDGTNGRTAGRIYISDLDDSTNRTQKFDGFVTSTIASGSTGYIKGGGIVSGFSGLSVGVTYYLSVTAGGITTTNTGVKVGVAISTTELLIQKEDSRVKIGVDSWTPTAVSQTKTITHNLGKKPKLIKITFWDETTPEDSFGFGMYDGSNYATIYVFKNANPGNDSGTDSSHIIVKDKQTSGTTGWTATVTSFGEDSVVLTVDAFSTSEKINFSWEVLA